jgi:hypothetical protein
MLKTVVDWFTEGPALGERLKGVFDGSGFAFIVCCVTIGFCVAVAVSKKVRNKFF